MSIAETILSIYVIGYVICFLILIWVSLLTKNGLTGQSGISTNLKNSLFVSFLWPYILWFNIKKALGRNTEGM